MDVSAEPELSVWDVAALLPIVEEAGGRTSGVAGDQSLTAPEPASAGGVSCRDGLVCSNGLVHDEALGLLGSSARRGALSQRAGGPTM